MVSVQAFYDKYREQYVCMKKSMTILSVKKSNKNKIRAYIKTNKQKKESDPTQDLIMVPFFSVSMLSEYKLIQ